MKYLLAFALILVAIDVRADFYTADGAKAFETFRGTLIKASVRFKQDNVQMTTPSHTHAITTTSVSYSPVGAIPTASLVFNITSGPGGNLTTSTVGDHTHSFTPSFTWNGKNITLSTVTSSAGGAHSHNVTNLVLFDPGFGGSGVATIQSGTIESGGGHSQTFSFDQTIDFTGSDLSMFLGPGNPSETYSGAFTVNGGNHTHMIASGRYTVEGENLGSPVTFQIDLLGDILLSNSSTGNHSVNLSGQVLETTFEYTPFSAVPEPSSFILFSVVAGAGAVGRRFWKKRNQVG